MHLTFQNLILGLWLLLITIFAVACSSKAQQNDPIGEAQQTLKQEKEIKPCRTEPLFNVVPNDSKSKNMEAAWKQFTANSQYRLACDADGDISLDAIEQKTIESYRIAKQSRSITNWGDWNFPKRTYEDHLAAIVVDTTRTDANRFGLVVFSPPQSKKNAYDVNWLYRDRDLSRASVGMSSGSVWTQDYTPDGKGSLCWIVWNKKKNLFECRDTSR
jgi:hypothetical protein